jgi:hypothetical protein
MLTHRLQSVSLAYISWVEQMLLYSVVPTIYMSMYSENAGASTSHNSMGLHGLIQG